MPLYYAVIIPQEIVKRLPRWANIKPTFSLTANRYVTQFCFSVRHHLRRWPNVHTCLYYYVDIYSDVMK